jgi:hypothetical protein
MRSTASNPVGSTDTLTTIRGSNYLLSGVDLAGMVLIEQFRAPSPELADRPLKLIHTLDELERRLEPGTTSFDVDEFDRLERELDEYRFQQIVTPNIITQTGDQYYGERAAGIGGAPGQVTGMKLGTGSTAVAKTGAGAALVTYKSGSQKAIDGSFPTSALSGSSRRIQWKTSWGAGVINGSALTEVVLVIDTLADATSSAANTIARALFGPLTLGVLDTLALTWNHDLLGAP